MTASTQYAFCAKAHNEDNDETDFSSTAGTGTTLATPSFIEGPSDGGSSSAAPTDEGDSVTFTAKSNNGANYWSLVCKNGNAPTVGSPPECNGGAGNRWARSAETATNVEASATFDTTSHATESNVWYAFVCDTGSCSSSSQGTGNNGSPFIVNHAPTFGTVTVTDDSDGTIEPDDTLKFKLPQAQIDDTDVVGGQDWVSMTICTDATTSFNYGTHACVGGTSVCTSTVDPTTTDAACTSGISLVPIPTAHGSYNFKVYVYDPHDMPSSSGTNQQSYSVTDVAPALTSYSTADTLSISAGGSDTMSYSVSLYDNNGDNDVTGLEMVFFEDTSVNNDCSADDNDCIIENIAGNCSFTGQGDGLDKDLGADCDFTVWFNASASGNWEVHAKPTDGIGQETGFADSNDNNVIASLSGIDVIDGLGGENAIAYKTVTVGGTSILGDLAETSMGNVGNQVIDVYIEGDAMCTDYPTCSGGTISYVQQKWHSATANFDWDIAEADPGPWVLEDTASGTDETTGCANRDIAVRNDHTSTSTNESVYWKIRIPAAQSAGSYTGQNTFTTTASSTCSGGTLH